MFHPDFRIGAPTGDDLLSELGVCSELVREIINDDRAIRCADRDATWSDRRFADFAPTLPDDDGLHEAGPDEPWDPAPAQRPADRSWRRA